MIIEINEIFRDFTTFDQIILTIINTLYKYFDTIIKLNIYKSKINFK